MNRQRLCRDNHTIETDIVVVLVGRMVLMQCCYLAVVFLAIICSPCKALASSPSPLFSPLSPSSSSSTSETNDAVPNINRVAFQQQQVRASHYGIANNSTILSPMDAAVAVGVRPTHENATKGTWQRAWKLHRFMMRFILHKLDFCRPGDSNLAL